MSLLLQLKGLFLLGFVGLISISSGLAQNSKCQFQTPDGKPPLVMVDDVRLKDGLEMQLVASDDILEVTVIKDSSATLTYGSSAQDGVILIQTKSGTFEQKRRAYYHALIKEKLTWAEKRPRRKLQVQFVLNGTLLTDWEPLRNQKPSEVRDLRTLTSAEGRKEFQKKRKGLWYVIETVK